MNADSFLWLLMNGETMLNPSSGRAVPNRVARAHDATVEVRAIVEAAAQTMLAESSGREPAPIKQLNPTADELAQIRTPPKKTLFGSIFGKK